MKKRDIGFSVAKVMKALGKRRVFHSEADFQHAFAWEAQGQNPSAEIRLEIPFKAKVKAKSKAKGGKRLHLDILIEWGGKKIAGGKKPEAGKKSVALELKYKTCEIAFKDKNGESFSLQNHGAHSDNWGAFLRDIARLRDIVLSRNHCVGWAVLLTNDKHYWPLPQAKEGKSKTFSAKDGGELKEALKWSKGTGKGTKKGHKKTLGFSGCSYKLKWEDFKEEKEDNGHFRYLSVLVKKCPARKSGRET